MPHNHLFFRLSAGGGRIATPKGVIVLWYGTAEEIPAGFSLYSTAENLFIRGAAQGEKNTTPVGQNTHTHNVPGTELAGAHTHNVSVNTGVASSVTLPGYSDGVEVANPGHTHAISGITAEVSGHSHATPTSNNASHLPPYLRLYYIRQVQVSDLPVKSIIMMAVEPDDLGEGWVLCDGTNGTPDLRDKFVYAASSNGEVGLTGGNNSHSHVMGDTEAAGSHSHVFTGGTQGNGWAASGKSHGGSGNVLSVVSHAHSFSTTTSSIANHTHSMGGLNSKEVLPPYAKLYYFMRAS